MSQDTSFHFAADPNYDPLARQMQGNGQTESQIFVTGLLVLAVLVALAIGLAARLLRWIIH